MFLRTLGELKLEGSDFSRPKPLLLLAYLALEGSKPRRYLADLFFMDTKDPYNGLAQALKLLRKMRLVPSKQMLKGRNDRPQ